MKIIVCVKQVIDPEAPPSTFSIDPANKTAQFKGAAPVIDPFAEYAVEAALKLKESTGATVTIISFGDNLQRDVIKKPLAMGADELVLIEDSSIPTGNPFTTATVLAETIKKIADYNLILCGREASDTNSGQTGPGIAELLSLPCITLARKIGVDGNQLTVERVTATGYDIINAEMPAVITVSNEIGEARYPTIKGIMAAKKITPMVWKATDMGAGTADELASKSSCQMETLFQPTFEGQCEFVEGETPEETGSILAAKLREAKVL